MSTPPATVYAIYDRANRDMAEQLAAWRRLKGVYLPTLNALLKANHQQGI